MKNIFVLTMAAVLLQLCGCGTMQKSGEAALQGTWTGKELGRESQGDCTLIVTGRNVEFRGSNPQEWYKATFTVRNDVKPAQIIATVTECPSPRYVGKTSYGLYKIEKGTLTLSANEPGSSAPPAEFKGPGTRTFVMTKH